MDEIPREQLSGALRRGAVKKHVAAIHISGKLTLLQRKLSNVLLLNAYDTLISQARHQIDARTLCLMIGYNSHDMETLKTSLRGLVETIAEWDMFDEDGKHEWGVSSLLSYARLKGGTCEYAYSPALAEKLHDPKVFALINLDIQRRFTSGHALALYENCYRFMGTGSTGWWPIEVFRRLMGVDGSSYYETFKHLNAKIIKPAVAEVNRTSNIALAPEIRRNGRAVAEIRFRIQDNPQLAILALDDGEGLRQGPVYARLRELGVSDRLARQWLSTHGEAQVSLRLDYIEARPNVKSKVGYLTAALEGQYESLGGAGEAVPQDGRAERLRRILEAVKARSPIQRDADRRLFMAQLSDGTKRADFEKHGWLSPLNSERIAAFWEEMNPGLLSGLKKGGPRA